MANHHQKTWIIQSLNGFDDSICRDLKISPLTAQILFNRGIKDKEQVSKFLFPALTDLPDPFSLRDIDKAAIRLSTAIKKQEKITIFGDYDVDGTTATALLLLFLKRVGAQVDYYIPHRLREGYGLNIEALQKIRRQGTDLLVTVDCGISNIEEVKWAQENGLEVIITDHHEVPEELPPAFAILNPKQKNCNYPFKELAGVGVVFNLLIALRHVLRQKDLANPQALPNLKEFLDLVALGTAADVVPLLGANRLFVKFGLTQLQQSTRPGIRALKEVAAIGESPIDTNTILFRFGPRINAAGRLGDAHEAVKLFSTDNEQEAQRIASRLDQANSLRQRIEEKIYASAKEMIISKQMWPGRKSFVLTSPEWHPGVIGIVASRLAEEFYRPTILIACQEGIARGSGRSIASFPLFLGLKKCHQWMEAFGGHAQAAGLLIRPEHIPSFAEAFEAVVRKSCQEEDFIPSLSIDSWAQLSHIDEPFFQELEAMAPFGPGNPEPVLATDDLEVLESRLVGKNHMRLRLQQGRIFREAICFNMAHLHPLNKGRIKLAFSPTLGFYQGRKTLELKVVDIQREER